MIKECQKIIGKGNERRVHLAVSKGKSFDKGIPLGNLFFCNKILERTGEKIAVTESICKRCEEDEKFFDNICKKVKNLPNPEEIREKNKLSTEQLAKTFIEAMKRWKGSGFKLVTKEIYIARRQLCSACTYKGKCPICGCYLWAKAALATEKCPKGKW